MRKYKLIRLLKENDWKKKITYLHRNERVTVYSNGKYVCEVASGVLFAHSLLFMKNDGTLLGFHNLRSGYKWYSEVVKKNLAE